MNCLTLSGAEGAAAWIRVSEEIDQNDAMASDDACGTVSGIWGRAGQGRAGHRTVETENNL
jgi:hypothetical protein